jgi:hypothetical protein
MADTKQIIPDYLALEFQFPAVFHMLIGTAAAVIVVRTAGCSPLRGTFVYTGYSAPAIAGTFLHDFYFQFFAGQGMGDKHRFAVDTGYPFPLVADSIY